MQIFHSFKHAIDGIATAVRTGRNMCIIIACAAVVILLGFLCGLSGLEWAVILLCCGGMIFAELINTALESVVDMMTTEHLPLAKKAKDIAAGAVLVFAVFTVAIGLIVFIPYIVQWLGK